MYFILRFVLLVLPLFLVVVQLYFVLKILSKSLQLVRSVADVPVLNILVWSHGFEFVLAVAFVALVSEPVVVLAFESSVVLVLVK